MTKKTALLAILFAVIFTSASLAAPTPPSKGQWAFPLENTLRLYDKADDNSDYTEIDVPQKWISVPSAVRDRDNYLWYKVKVDGQNGWLPQNGIRLKMGGKSKSASNVYKTYVKARQKVMNKPGKWSSSTDGNITTYTTDGGEFRVIRNGKRVEDIYFSADSARICREMLGIDLIDFSQPEVRSKLGTPTMRETPANDPDMSVLSFELPDRNMTLSITERRYDGDKDGTVIGVELYAGATGEPEY